MKLIRYASENGAQRGCVIDGVVYVPQGSAHGARPWREVGPIGDVRLLAPVEPSKVVCVGRNFAVHIAEMGLPSPEWPFVFLKAPNAIVGPEEPVLRPKEVERFDFEGELAVVIGEVATRVREDDWRRYVRGFSCGNDLTVRDWQESDGQWARAKSADTLCPIGPWVESEVDDPENLTLRTYVNGQARQDSRTNDFVFGIGQLLAFISSYLTLFPDDVVLTGTPGGIGGLDVGDVVEVEVGGVGRLRNPVVEAAR